MDERFLEIQRELDALERAEDAVVLFAIESGSRAWGIASPDSDYDVRFVYVRPVERYLRIDKGRDVIEWKLDDVLDINGWDLHKALRLLHDSNATLFEWMASDIVYRRLPRADAVFEAAHRYFQPRVGLCHYLNGAKTDHRGHLTGEIVRRKKYLYALRRILACRHILALGTPPPMRFEVLLQRYMDADTLPLVEALLRDKLHAPETEEMPRVDALNAYIERNIADIETRVKGMPAAPRPDMRELDELFLDALGIERRNDKART